MTKRIVAVLSLLVLIACTATVTTNLPLVVTTAQNTFPAIALAAQLSAADTINDEAWLRMLQIDISQVTIIQASGKSPDVQDAEIVAVFANSTAPTLAPGTPATVAAVIATVSEAVALYLSAYQVSTSSNFPARLEAKGKARAALPITAPITLHLSEARWRALSKAMRAGIQPVRRRLP